VGQAFAGGQTVTINGLNANNSYTATSVAAFSASQNPALLRKPTWIMLSQVKAFELGYRFHRRVLCRC
jgi:hypothetical protein